MLFEKRMSDAVAVAFDALKFHASALARTRTLDLFAEDPARFKNFSVKLDDFLFDFSKHRVTRETIALLISLAQTRDLDARREALFSGERINNTERRAAMHMALRDLSSRPLLVGGENMRPLIEAERDKVFAFARAVRSGDIRGATGAPFSDVVNIGIGGSDLGPAMASRALSPYRGEGPRMHFVANVDGADLADTLQNLDPARTLFIVSSKTFTTQETMTNAQKRARLDRRTRSARRRSQRISPPSRPALDKVAAFGIDPDRASSASGIGSAGAIRCGRRSAYRWRSASARSASSSSCGADTTSTRISSRRRLSATFPC